MSSKPIVISIDGFASTGKSTLAKKISNHLEYNYVDTGSIYRAITLFSINNGFCEPDSIKLNLLKEALNESSFVLNSNSNELYFNDNKLDEEIRSHRVSEKVSVIAKIPFVRSFVLNQLRLLKISKGLVIEGRDIGTVVFPNANYKFFFNASIDTRVNRRWNEMTKKNIKISKTKIKENIISRDKTDKHRKISPLIVPKDSIQIDTSNLTIEEVFDIIINHLK
ncbi:MAG: cytidylate kinase [Flavobacteriaceae bacterium]|nr:cytidylate kinase [Flavobacteriaceae bacterium]|tara:strand:+ start:4199 stop:4867 length:669 start_codon:yes stop_codon:yes gene_type:complete